MSASPAQIAAYVQLGMFVLQEAGQVGQVIEQLQQHQRTLADAEASRRQANDTLDAAESEVS